MENDVSFKVDTFIEGDIIKQEVSTSFLNMHTIVFRQIMDTQEEQIRQALIKLGWTPPVKGEIWIIKR
jgi:hypothetical protein